jgi:glycine oxidase
MGELPKTTEVAIIGGGVIGLAVARALSLRGVRDVLVIERGSLGAESSGAAAGMLAPQAEADSADDFFHLCARSRDLYPVFAAKLLEGTRPALRVAIQSRSLCRAFEF